ncbi:MAG TPA: PHB depolymerase family esterase [Vicinamibacterales bacterium]|nr:PHB depolymerase family esterase [Vicinamibacterales bacterium]
MNGVARTYRLHVPISFQKNAGALVIVLHGSGGNGLGMEVGTGFSSLADQVGFAVVYPDGLFESMGGQTNWAYFFNDFADDVGFIRQLVQTLEGSIQFDPRKVYVTGLSSGALMSHRLGVQLADRVAAIGVVEGALFYDAPANGAMLPSAGAPVSVLILHGDHDGTIPTCGTPTEASQDQTFNYWAGSLACSRIDPLDPVCDGQGNITAVTEKVASSCNANAEVRFYKLIGGTHTWNTVPMNVPGQAPFNPNFNGATGVTTRDILWNFFAAHPKP